MGGVKAPGRARVQSSRVYCRPQRLPPIAGGALQCAAQVLTAVASLVAEHGLHSTGSGCGPRAHFLHGTQHLSGPAIEPASPALAGGFSTTGQPGKSWVGGFEEEQFEWMTRSHVGMGG